MAAGDINDALTNIPNVVLVDQADASAAPGAGYARLEVVDGVLGVRVGTGAWVALVSLVAGLLTSLTEKATPADTDLLLLQDEASGSALKKVQVGNLPGGAPGGGLYDAYLSYADEKSQNTNGGTFTQGSWQTRVLNTERADTASIGSLSTNQITLPAGTYRCLISCPAHQVNAHQARLYDTTGAAALVLGENMFSYSTNATSNPSRVAGRFTLSQQSVLEVQHRCESTKADNGLGPLANFGTEVYTVAEFWREA